MDSQTATTILTDIIAQTNKFQHPKVNPQALKTASVLIEKGADYQRASNKQGNQKSFSLLSLWGEVLSGLKCDNEIGICWSVLAEHCFTKTNTMPAQIPQLLLRLCDYIYPKETIIVFWSDPPQTKIYSSFGMRAIIISSLPDLDIYLQPCIRKNDFIIAPLKGKEIHKASNDLIEHLRFTLSKKSIVLT